MKKKYKAICIACLFLMMSAFTQEFAKAAEFKAGVYSYYAWWKPGFRSIYDEYNTDPLLLYGPVLSLTIFDDFTLSCVVISNYFNQSDVSYQYSSTGSNGPYTIDVESTKSRIDIDIAMTYRINNILKIFAGYKMMELKEKEDSIKWKITGAYTSDFSGIGQNTSHSEGTGCGISISYPLADNIAVSLNTSVIYLNSYLNMNRFFASGTQILHDTKDYNYYSIGNNTGLSLSYNIPQIDTVIVLGGRYQVLKNYAEGDCPALDNDYFYGITLSAVYTF